MNRKKGYFSISAVAQMFDVHQQTIRLYEREGLVCPKRSEGNTRLFSEEDINRLEEIIHLTHKLGINLAGVDMILKQQKKIEKLQKEINNLFKHMHDELEDESAVNKKNIANVTQRLAHLKQQSQSALKSQKNNHHHEGDSHE